MQETLSVPNTVAAELASIGDGVLEHLRDRLRVAFRPLPGRSTGVVFDVRLVRPGQ